MFSSLELPSEYMYLGTAFLVYQNRTRSRTLASTAPDLYHRYIAAKSGRDKVDSEVAHFVSVKMLKIA